MSFRNDRDWVEPLMPMVKTIIGPYLLMNAPLERDRLEATDLIVLRARDMTIGVRLRRRSARYYMTFPDEFTIRCRRESGAMTELKKIDKGWGDWFFYGHADTTTIDPWMLLDLAELRYAFIREPDLLHAPDGIRSGVKNNGDGTLFFFFNRRMLPAAVTIACSEESVI